MKKIRMIVTAVIVLTVVGSAFSFKVKAKGWCILNSNSSGTDCTTYIQNMKTAVTGTSYKYAPGDSWNGDKATCTTIANHLCTSMGTLQFQAD